MKLKFCMIIWAISFLQKKFRWVALSTTLLRVPAIHPLYLQSNLQKWTSRITETSTMQTNGHDPNHSI